MKAVAARSFNTISIGKKVLMALSGLFLAGFLVAHLSGNLLLLKNDNGVAFSEYAEFMKHNPLIWFVEVVMFLGFGLHIANGISLTLSNSAARPVKYKVHKGSQTSTFFSRFMSIGGVVLLVFLLLHLWSFFVTKKLGIMDANPERSLYDEVVYKFSLPWYTGIYVLAMLALAMHLAHGVQSATQTLGLQVNKSVGNAIKALGYVLAVGIPAAFAAVPLYFLLRSL